MSIASATGTSVSGIHACSLPQTPYTSMQQGVRTQDTPEIHLEDESHQVPRAMLLSEHFVV